MQCVIMMCSFVNSFLKGSKDIESNSSYLPRVALVSIPSVISRAASCFKLDSLQIIVTP